jgi:choline dehydrogenase
MKRRPLVGAEWLLRKTGPGATNHFEAGGFVRGNEDVKYPNLMYHFLPIAVRYDGTLPEGGGGTATRCTWARCTRTCAARARS